MCMGIRVWQSSWGRGIPDSILVPLTVLGRRVRGSVCTGVLVSWALGVSESRLYGCAVGPRSPLDALLGARTYSTKDVSKINFFVYYEVDGDTSKPSLQSRTYSTAETKSGWVLLVAPAPCTHPRPHVRTVTQVYVGFLGSRGGHAAAFLNGAVS